MSHCRDPDATAMGRGGEGGSGTGSQKKTSFFVPFSYVNVLSHSSLEVSSGFIRWIMEFLKGISQQPFCHLHWFNMHFSNAQRSWANARDRQMGRSPVSHSLPYTDSEGHWRVYRKKCSSKRKVATCVDAVRDKTEKMCSKLWHFSNSSTNIINQMKEEKVHFLFKKKSCD